LNNVECNFQESYYGNDDIWPEGGHYGSETEFQEEYYSSSSDDDGYGGNCCDNESDHEYQADDEDEGPGQEEEEDDYDPDFDPSPGQFHDATDSEFTPDSNYAPYSDFEPSQHYDASDFYRSFMLPGMYYFNSHDNSTATMSADAARELRAWFDIPTPDASSDETEHTGSQAEDYNPNSDYVQQFYHVPASYPSVPVPPFYYNSAYNIAPPINNHPPTGPMMMMMTITPEAEADLRAWFDMPEADYVTTESDHDHDDDASS
jgi:hypothetical protein